MGDQKSKQFFCTLADPLIPTDFLRTLWTNRLQPKSHTIIATKLLGDVTQLEEVMPNPHTMTVSETSDIRAHRRTRPTFGCTNCTQLPPPLPSYVPLFILWWASKCSLCWYHCHFKERYKRCTAPCMWSQVDMDTTRPLHLPLFSCCGTPEQGRCKLFAGNRTTILTYGCHTLHLDFNR
jgi:hypothetical protein